MKKILSIIIFSFLSLNILAQENDIYYSYGEFTFSKNTEAYLFGNNVRLREEPNIKSPEITKLSILSKIILLEKTDEFQTVNGIKSYWIKVKTQNKIGYILDNFISSSFLSNNSIIFLTRIIKENDSYFLDMRKINSNESNDNAQQIKFKIPHNNISIESYGNKGLTNISNLIFIKYNSEACGVYGGGKYLFINNGEIITEIQLNEISEAGMFWKTEKLIFPENNKNLENNSIKFIQEIGNVIDESSQWYEKKIIERQYKIIGNKLVPEFGSKVE